MLSSGLFLVVGSYPQFVALDEKTLSPRFHRQIYGAGLSNVTNVAFWDVIQVRNDLVATVNYRPDYLTLLLQPIRRSDDTPLDFVVVGKICKHEAAPRRITSFVAPDGRQFVLSADRVGHVLVDDVDTMMNVFDVRFPRDQTGDYAFYSVCHIPSGMTFGSPLVAMGGTAKKGILILDFLRRKTPLRVLNGHTSTVWTVRGSDVDSLGSFSSDPLLFSASSDHSCRQWDIRVDQPLVHMFKPCDAETRACAFVPERQLLHVASGLGDVFSYDLRNPSKPCSEQISVHPNGSYLYMIQRVGLEGNEVDQCVSIAWGGNRTVSVWDGATRKVLRSQSLVTRNWGLCVFREGRGCDHILCPPVEVIHVEWGEFEMFVEQLRVEYEDIFRMQKILLPGRETLWRFASLSV